METAVNISIKNIHIVVNFQKIPADTESNVRSLYVRIVVATMKPKRFFIAVFTIFTVFISEVSVSKSIDTTIIPMLEKSAKTFYVEAKLGGFGKSEFMVDTGSGYTVINEQTLEGLKQSGKATYVKDLLGLLADGSEKRVPVYRLSSFALSDSCEIYDIEVAIFPGSTRHILGLNTLRKMGAFEFSFVPPQLIFKQCGEA